MTTDDSQFIYGITTSADTPLASYQRSYSLLRRIRECEPFHRCNLPVHVSCTSRSATRAQQAVTARMPKLSRVHALTLTIKDVPDLIEGYERLASVRRLWELRIKNLSQAYVTSTELTDNTSSWHWHLHPVVFGSRVPGRVLIDTWLQAAQELGVVAHDHGQHVVTKLRQDAVSYALKPRLGSGPTSLRELGTRASTGDADAIDRWAEFETFYLDNPRRRWRSSWMSKPAPARITAPTFDYSDSPDLRRLVLLEYLGGAERSFSSKRVQAEALTALGYPMSTATVSRIRRHPLMSGRDRSPEERVS